MIRSLFLICILSLNLSAENNEQALKESLLKFWEARNARDFETIFFYESKVGAITGSSSENHFYEDPLNSYIPIPSAIVIANLYGKRVPINIIEKYIQDSRDWVNSLTLELDTLDYSRLIEEKYLKYKDKN